MMKQTAVIAPQAVNLGEQPAAVGEQAALDQSILGLFPEVAE